MGRYLGLDIGKKRIGIATSDVNKIIAFPHSVYTMKHIDDFIDRLKDLILEKNIEKIIIGLPLRTDNAGETEIAGLVRNIKDIIEQNTGISVVLFDERLSTIQAQKSLTSLGMKQKKQKGIIDMVAAQIILQAYLDSRRT